MRQSENVAMISMEEEAAKRPCLQVAQNCLSWSRLDKRGSFGEL